MKQNKDSPLKLVNKYKAKIINKQKSIFYIKIQIKLTQLEINMEA